MTEQPLHLPAEEVVYPESDGQPMGETQTHIDELAEGLLVLKRRYRDVPGVHVGGDLIFYYVEGDSRKSVVPDLFVVFGTHKEPRRIYKVWEEGRFPDVIIELTSKSTWRSDLGFKKDLYEDLGVREYILFDPLQEYLDPPLQGFTRGEDGRLAPMTQPVESELLDLAFSHRGSALVMTDRATGRELLKPMDHVDVLQERVNSLEEDARREAQRAEKEAQRAEKEAQRAEKGERTGQLTTLEPLLAERMGRDLDELERAALERRLDEMTPDGLVRHILGQDAAALEAWLRST